MPTLARWLEQVLKDQRHPAARDDLPST
jgi:hypothetical protein